MIISPISTRIPCDSKIRIVHTYTSMPESTSHLSITNAQSCTTCTTLCRSVSKGRLTSHDHRNHHPVCGLRQPCHENPDHTRDHATRTPTTPCVFSLEEERPSWQGRSRPAHVGQKTKGNRPQHAATLRTNQHKA